MNTSIKFLKQYIPDLKVDNEEQDRDFAEKLTISGTKVETYKRLNKNMSNIVVCKLTKVEKHPDADKLFVCQCDIGSNNDIQIVTGADNVYEGMICPAVLSGGVVPASAHSTEIPEKGFPIKAGKLRGIDSNGMLCSIGELLIDKDLYNASSDGIFDMKEFECKPGDDVVKILGLDNTTYEFEITSNRVDCYSSIGIAREVHATFNVDFKKPDISVKGVNSEENYIDLKIEDTNKCSLFSTRLVKNIKIEESPSWMKECLRSVGIRPINNIVDITNFVMMEYGCPMHAYNYDKINGKKIIVKTSTDGQKFTTLDEKEHTLDSNTLLICDEKGAIGLAGIMGGANSMITNDTKNLLLECANFDGTNIRVQSKKLGIRTDASNLFEKGLDKYQSLEAIDRACNLIEKYGWGEVCKQKITAFVDDSNNVKYIDAAKEEIIPKVETLTVSSSKINKYLGTNISSNEMQNILNKIDLETKVDNDNLVIKVPSWRKDIHEMADVSEEILRFYGYDKVEETFPKTNIIPELQTKADKIKFYAYDTALHTGFNEIKNYSFESKSIYDKLLYSNNAIERDTISILNPLGEDFSQMRTQLLNGMLKSLSTNFRNKNTNVKLFELARVYIKTNHDSKELNELPDERLILALGAYDNVDFYYMKGVLETFFKSCGIKRKLKFSPCDTNLKPYYHPGRSADVLVGKDIIAHLGEINQKVSDSYEIERRVYYAQIDLTSIYTYAKFETKFNEIPKFPAVERDLSMTVPKTQFCEGIEEIITKKGGKLLEECKLFDIYEGNQIGTDLKSMAYSLKFRAKDHTLVDKEVDDIIEQIINELKKLGVELRK